MEAELAVAMGIPSIDAFAADNTSYTVKYDCELPELTAVWDKQ